MRKKAYRYTRDDYVFVYEMLVLRSEGNSYPKIGKMFNKDHTTVMYWCRRFNVDIGKELPPRDSFGWRVVKPKEPEKYRYQHILEEPINKGKLTYAEYLRVEKRKKPRVES